MIIVSGSMQLSPDSLTKALELVRPLIAATRAEVGNRAYGFYLDPEQPGGVHLYEEWEDQAAIDTHNASDHLATFMASMAELEISSIEIHIHEVASSTRFM